MGKLSVSVVIRNDSSTSQSVGVGLTVGKNIGGSGCDLYTWGEYYDLRGSEITIPPNTTTTVSYTYDISLSKGKWYLIVKLWQRNSCLSGAYTSFTI